VLSNLTPVVVTAFAWIFLKQRPRGLFLLAVAVAVGGVWMMAAGKSGGGHVLNAPLGNLFSLSTALWYALYFLAVSEARKTEGASRVMFWSGVVGAPLVLIAALLLREQIAPATLAGWAACLGLGVVHVAGQGSIAWGLGRLPTSTASVVVLVQPIVAGVMGFVLFGEILGPVQAVGMAVTLGGVVLAQWASRPRPEAIAAPA
jgi:drug/metabolite transporter (DMT)-like permease